MLNLNPDIVMQEEWCGYFFSFSLNFLYYLQIIMINLFIHKMQGINQRKERLFSCNLQAVHYDYNQPQIKWKRTLIIRRETNHISYKNLIFL